MKNLSTGTGLALLAGAILAWPILDRLMPNANALGVGTTAVTAVAAAATAQGAPTIVWYGTSPPMGNDWSGEYLGVVFRAWSDGKIEYKMFNPRWYTGQGCVMEASCVPGWRVFSAPSEGLTYRSDINFDEKVDGADLGQLLADWGNAPRQDIPPSDCPLALINP
jgi:hypothetical protein